MNYSLLKKIYLVLGAALLAVYSSVALFGWEFPKGKRAVVPTEQRKAGGGHRSFHYWYFHGYRGGK